MSHWPIPWPCGSGENTCRLWTQWERKIASVPPPLPLPPLHLEAAVPYLVAREREYIEQAQQEGCILLLICTQGDMEEAAHWTLGTLAAAEGTKQCLELQGGGNFGKNTTCSNTCVSSTNAGSQPTPGNTMVLWLAGSPLYLLPDP